VFFFQAEDGIRDVHVTGVQTCALPIFYLKVGLYAGLFVASPFIFWQIWLFVAPGLYRRERKKIAPFVLAATLFFVGGAAFCYLEIGRASCRERGLARGGGGFSL